MMQGTIPNREKRDVKLLLLHIGGSLSVTLVLICLLALPRLAVWSTRTYCYNIFVAALRAFAVLR